MKFLEELAAIASKPFGWVDGSPRSMEDLSDADLFDHRGYRLRHKNLKRKEFVSGAIRNSIGKPRYDLIPYEHAREMAKVLTYGVAKYAERNWEKGIPFSELYASAARHIEAFLSGEMHDPETGLLHVSHVCWNFMAIETMILRGRSEDLNDLSGVL